MIRAPWCLVVSAVLVGCGQAEQPSKFDWLPEQLRADAVNATGYEKAALGDGRVSREEVFHGLELHAECLRGLGYVAWVDSYGQIGYSGSPMPEAQYDECGVGNTEVLPVAYSIMVDGSPDEQRQRQIDCLIGVGTLEPGATSADFSELMHERKVRKIDLSEAEWDCMAQAVRGRVGI